MSNGSIIPTHEVAHRKTVFAGGLIPKRRKGPRTKEKDTTYDNPLCSMPNAQYLSRYYFQ
jgi:hypothetical protein